MLKYISLLSVTILIGIGCDAMQDSSSPSAQTPSDSTNSSAASQNEQSKPTPPDFGGRPEKPTFKHVTVENDNASGALPEHISFNWMMIDMATRHFKKIDWVSPDSKQQVTVAFEDKESLIFEDVHEEMSGPKIHVTWKQQRGDDSFERKTTIDSSETADKILEAFLDNDPSLNTLAEWQS